MYGIFGMITLKLVLLYLYLFLYLYSYVSYITILLYNKLKKIYVFYIDLFIKIINSNLVMKDDIYKHEFYKKGEGDG